MTFDVHFWELVCFVVFAVLIYVYTKEPLLQYLDSYSASVNEQITKANQIHDEAKKNLDHFTNLNRSLNRKLHLISKHTKENINVLRQETDALLTERIKMRQQAYKERMQMCDRKDFEHERDVLLQRAVGIAHRYIANHAPLVTESEVNGMLETIRTQKITIH